MARRHRAFAKRLVERAHCLLEPTDADSVVCSAAEYYEDAELSGMNCKFVIDFMSRRVGTIVPVEGFPRGALLLERDRRGS